MYKLVLQEKVKLTNSCVWNADEKMLRGTLNPVVDDLGFWGKN